VIGWLGLQAATGEAQEQKERLASRSTLALCGLGISLIARMLIAGPSGPASQSAGVMFAIMLAATAILTGWRPERVTRTALRIGCLGAGILLVGPIVSRCAGHLAPVALPISQFPRWAIIVTVVALSEEMVMRGSLFDDLLDHWGPGTAYGVTTVVFALLHVPLYGWRALPLDLAVGSVLGLLRLRTNGMTAPALAHVMADLASWWL
jgi:membrane protease YdiL (CAAX protease family)